LNPPCIPISSLRQRLVSCI